MYGMAWVLATLVALSTQATLKEIAECPSTCKCYSTSVAVCTELTDKFNINIRQLQIVNPTATINLESDLFQNIGLASLNTLNIENAEIGSIDRKAFRNMTDLITIKIINSILPDIDSDTFVECINLKSLSFTGSLLEKFDYIKSESIEELNLSNCSLVTITNANFDNFSELVYLNLAYNSLTKIEPSTFSNLINLEEINLSHNWLSEITPNLFENNTQLDTLDISYNPLTSFAVNSPSDLEKLVLKSCKLTEIDESINKNLDLLRHLDLSGNYIKEVTPESFSNLEELFILDLSENNIVTLDADVFKNNYKLQKIILDNNSLKTLPSFNCVQNGFYTNYFSCKNCHLKLLTEDTFVRMPAMVTLKLSDNKLDKAHFLRKLRSLSELDLSNNNIKSFAENEFSKNSALTNLNLAGNPLVEVNPKMFSKNEFLTKLDISLCGLTKLFSNSSPYDKISSLRELTVANNEIRTITREELSVVPNLVYLEIRGNPLTCGESFCDLIEYLNNEDITQLPVSSEMNSANSELTLTSPWSTLVNASCGNIDTCDYDYYEDEEQIEPKLKIDEISKNEIFEETEIDLSEIQVTRTDNILRRYPMVWPALVFVTTALLVLLIVANVTLLVLRKKGQLNRQMGGLPQIKIIPWGDSNKLKKHSGSVYHPLSEDRTGPRTPVISRKYEQVPTSPEVHKPTL